MKSIIRWSINNHVAVNLLMIFVVVTGLLTLRSMRREVFPQFSLDFIYVSVVYPGATPEEIEEGICIKIEEQIKGIEGISTIWSTSSEGMGSVTAELDVDSDAEVQHILDEIKTEVDRIDTFPGDSEKPVIIEIVLRDPVISVAILRLTGWRTPCVPPAWICQAVSSRRLAGTYWSGPRDSATLAGSSKISR